MEIEGTPGPLLVYGDHVVPLITGSRGHTLAAYYRFGGQRIVWLTHDSLQKPEVLTRGDNLVFMQNVMEVVSGGDKEAAVLCMDTGDFAEVARSWGYAAEGVRRLPESLGSYRTVVINFSNLGPGVLLPEEIELMEDYLSEGGSCIAFGLGWVFNSYGDGKRGADLAGDYSGNRLLGAYGALWTGVYGGKEGRPAEPAEGHLAFEIREMLDLIEEGGLLGPEETKAMIGRFSQFGVTRRALHLMFSPAEQEGLLDFLGFPGRVTVPALESPLALTDSSKVAALLLANAFLPELCASDAAFEGSLTSFPSFGKVPSPGPDPRETDLAAEGGWISTGLYVLPGEETIVRITPSDAAVRLRTGIHTDNLFHSRRSEWRRWPVITSLHGFNEGRAVFTDPFGGPLYAERLDGESREISLHVEGAVNYPVYRKGITGTAEWERMLSESRVPWGEIVCDRLIITTTVDALKKADPRQVCNFWDDRLREYAELAGEEIRNCRERIAFDVQLSSGYMHNGYPVMAHLDRAETVLQGALAGCDGDTAYKMWGFFHEFGHNWQDRSYTPSYMGEITVNIFTMCANRQAYGISPAVHEMPRRAGLPYLKEYLHNPDPAALGSTSSRGYFTGLYLFIYLIEEFGWDPMRKTLHLFRDLPEAPSSDEEKMDLWIRFYSLSAARNLVPYFARWGFDASEDTVSRVADLPVWTWEPEL